MTVLLYLYGYVPCIESIRHGSQEGRVAHQNPHCSSIAHVKCVQRQIDAACEQIRQEEQGEPISVVGVENAARGTAALTLLGRRIGSPVYAGECNCFNQTKHGQLAAVEGTDPEHVRQVCQSPGYAQRQAVLV